MRTPNSPRTPEEVIAFYDGVGRLPYSISENIEAHRDLPAMARRVMELEAQELVTRKEMDGWRELRKECNKLISKLSFAEANGRGYRLAVDKLAAQVEELRKVEKQLLDRWIKVFSTYEWTDAQTAVDLLVAEVITARMERDKVAAQVEELQIALQFANRKREESKEIVALQKELAEAREERNKVRSYAEHVFDCPRLEGSICNCGLEALLAETEQAG